MSYKFFDVILIKGQSVCPHNTLEITNDTSQCTSSRVLFVSEFVVVSDICLSFPAEMLWSQ